MTFEGPGIKVLAAMVVFDQSIRPQPILLNIPNASILRNRIRVNHNIQYDHDDHRPT